MLQPLNQINTMTQNDATPLYGELIPSNASLSDPAALARQFAEQGYLYFQQLLPLANITAAHNDIRHVLHKHGWINQHDMAIIEPTVEGEDNYFAVYDEIQKLESFHSLAHEPAVIQVMQALLGPTAWPHPLSISRLVFPFNEEFATPPHQDYPNNQGTADLYACWIPLTECPRTLGSLAVVPGSHKKGVIPLKYALGAGHRQADIPPEISRGPWLTTDFSAGDAIIFHSLTVHKSLPNLSNGMMRLSVDYRYQREHEALTEQSLLPHFNRVSWDQIYQQWRSTALQYYWQKKSYSIVPWDNTAHELPEDSIKEAIRLNKVYKKKRAERHQNRATPK